MLHITIPEEELFNSETNEIYTLPKVEVKMEHSLLALSKWESKWHKPFLTEDEKTQEETIDYVRCMMVGSEANDPTILQRIGRNPKVMKEIQEYLMNPMTATVISQNPNAPAPNEYVTAEIIYYDMIAMQIPIEFEKWHLNRLMTLIKVCSIKNAPQKNMSMNEVYARQAQIKAANRAKFRK